LQLIFTSAVLFGKESYLTELDPTQSMAMSASSSWL